MRRRARESFIKCKTSFRVNLKLRNDARAQEDNEEWLNMVNFSEKKKKQKE